MEGWYVAKSKPQKDHLLLNYLSQWGVKVFAPSIIQPGRGGQTIKPLFPTYLFCHLDPKSSVWPVVRWAPGMAYFLSCDNEPIQVAQEMIDYLTKQADRWNNQGFPRHLAPGEKIMVMSGPFAGLEGIFQEYLPSKQRCRILLEVVGRLARVELSEWDVKEMAQAMDARRLGITPAV